MKSLIVSVSVDVYRAARLQAAERGQSVSALVVEFLHGLSERESEPARLKALQHHMQEEIGAFRAGARVTSDE